MLYKLKMINNAINPVYVTVFTVRRLPVSSLNCETVDMVENNVLKIYYILGM